MHPSRSKETMAEKKRLTLKGFQALSSELDELSRVERPKVVKGVSDAAAEGDRSENAEYIYGKKRLREIDKRLAYLASLLKDVEVIDPASVSGDTVQFGATVVIEDEEGAVKRYMIVGEGEADLKNGTISYKAPVARALLGRRRGDTVTIERPAGEIEVEIKDIVFDAGRAA
jgi:transcription elongation factor GreB